MIEYPYLIAIALIEQDGERLMPLGGKSLTTALNNNENPMIIGQSLIQQLLIRVFQLSEKAPVKRYFGNKSLLLIQIPMLAMQEQIPLIKSEWINTGETEKLISQLNEICEGVWQVLFTREEGLSCSKVHL